MVVDFHMYDSFSSMEKRLDKLMSLQCAHMMLKCEDCAYCDVLKTPTHLRLPTQTEVAQWKIPRNLDNPCQTKIAIAIAYNSNIQHM